MVIFLMSIFCMGSTLQFYNKAGELKGDPDLGLVQAEHKFAGSSGDRFNPESHDYAAIYSKYLSQMPLNDAAHTIVELSKSGDGLAIWSEVFPRSSLYGFNVNTDHWGTHQLKDDSYWKNLDNLKKGGFDNSQILVQTLEQVINNTELLQSTFGSKGVHPNIIIDDGYHSPDPGWFTFRVFYPFLADHFMYFIEDIEKEELDKGKWDYAKSRILEDCAGCKFSFECPGWLFTKTKACMAVITTY